MMVLVVYLLIGHGIRHPAGSSFYFSPNQFLGVEVLSSQTDEPQKKTWCTSILRVAALVEKTSGAESFVRVVQIR